jgi:hypothetical protein|tara:strand:- start:762 stop:1145 length:384 start_codon:yes stop_codon:yes gene_type:complete
MTKPINITETQLIKLIEDELENNLTSNTYDVEYDVEDEIDLSPEESFDEKLLSPEEIVGLMEEQIGQLQDRVDYSEELLADVVEFTSSLMGDLDKSEDLNLRRSKQKFRALETRAGREMFWIQSRRL